MMLYDCYRCNPLPKKDVEKCNDDTYQRARNLIYTVCGEEFETEVHSKRILHLASGVGPSHQCIATNKEAKEEECLKAYIIHICNDTILGSCTGWQEQISHCSDQGNKNAQY